MADSVADAHEGVAVLLMLSADDAARFAVDDGEPAEAMHVTLAYLTQPAADYDADQREQFTAALQVAARALPVSADVFGTAHLNPDDDERDPCAVLLVQSDELAAIHATVGEALDGELSTTFPIWLPHITVAYNADPTVIPDGVTGPVTFDRLILAWGDEQIDLAPTAADLAREAFAIGWAAATATNPVALTERARVACEAAVRVAEASPQPATQATLQLGQLEGIWAVIYARREAVEKLHGAALRDTLDAIAKLDWTQIIDRIQAYALANPGIERAALADILATDVKNLIAQQLPADEAAAWRAAMTAALIDAQAEGKTAALSLVADAANIQIDWNLAATDAIKALQGNQQIFDTASGWIEQQIHGLSYQISQQLATMWQDGATAEEMAQELAALLGTSDTIAATILDQAIGTALSQGALSTYADAGVLYSDFITAGDGRVCPACGEAEDNSPYKLEECPQPPLHVRCRCAVSPSDYVPTSAALQLVQTYQDSSGEDMAA